MVTMTICPLKCCALILVCVCARRAESAPVGVAIEPGVYPILVKPMPEPKAVRMLRIRPMQEPEPVVEPVRPLPPDPERIGRHILEGRELAAFWREPDYDKLTAGAERARAYDRHDRFAAAWAELSTNELSAAGLLLKANYLMYGRAGVVAPNPAAADELIESLVARVEKTGGTDEDRASASVALMMHTAADYETRAGFLYRARILLHRSTYDMGDWEFGGVPSDAGLNGQHARAADVVSAFLATGGAGAAFEVFVTGQVRTNGRGNPFTEAEPAEYEYFLRYAAIRGHARARAFFDAGGKLLTGDAYEYAVAPYRADYYARQPYLPLKGAPGFGRRGEIDVRGGYAVDDELRSLMQPYALTAHVYDVPYPAMSDRRSLLHGSKVAADIRAADEGNLGDCGTCQPGRLPFLSFAPTVTNGESAALVVYMPGSGEQGRDLKLQFRQTACIRKVTSAGFQTKHPAYLLVIMPPSYGNVNIPGGYLRMGDNMITESYSDLILDFVRSARTPVIDPSRIYLTGLGSGGTAAIAMALDHPGRYAAVMPVWALPVHSLVHPSQPGAWWFALQDLADTKARMQQRIVDFAANVKKGGGSCRSSFHGQLASGCWWDAFWLGDEPWDWAFARHSSGEAIGLVR